MGVAQWNIIVLASVLRTIEKYRIIESHIHAANTNNYIKGHNYIPK